MTTYQRPESIARSVPVAGVPWPLHKLCALGVGAVVFGVMLFLMASMSTAVLSGAAVASLVWIAGSLAR